MSAEWTPKCPTCNRALTVAPGATPAQAWPYRPFCSERCRSIDLGSWLDGAFRISTPVSEEDLDGAPAAEADPDEKPIN
jgi:endogenous inhibitor of DNA gyrase (YacG/DUF329 family)